ncbi:MAG: PQQ-like beta-propeller repeat protein [Calditrichaeota bacterium]|nr:PQQ-like beta-propeller repeat protein [Calditrichota bacterium]
MRRVVFLSFVVVSGVLVWCTRDKTPLGPVERAGLCPQQEIPWPSLANSPWPAPHGDMQCTGRARYPGPREGRLEWVFQPTRERVFNAPVIGEDGTIYVLADYHLYAVNPDGSLKWEFPTGYISLGSVVVGAGDIIYFAAGTSHREPGIWGYLWALDNKGNVLWEYKTSGMFEMFSPAIGLDGTIYLADSEGYLHAIDKTGRLRWKAWGDCGFYCRWWSSIAVSPEGTRLYLGGRDSTLCAVAAATGLLLWKVKVGWDVDWAPLVDNEGNVYSYGLEEDRFECYIVSVTPEGRLRWKCDIPEVKGIYFYGLDMHMDKGGNLYVCDWWRLYSIDCQGKLRWAVAYPDHDVFSPNTPILGDSQGNVFLLMGSHYMYAFGGDGQLLFECPTGGASGVCGAISDRGRMYLTVGTRLLCIK